MAADADGYHQYSYEALLGAVSLNDESAGRRSANSCASDPRVVSL
jgi:hypothetical protein